MAHILVLMSLLNIGVFFQVFDLSIPTRMKLTLFTSQDDVARELKALAKEIERSKKDLERVTPQYEQLLADEEEIIKG